MTRLAGSYQTHLLPPTYTLAQGAASAPSPESAPPPPRPLGEAGEERGVSRVRRERVGPCVAAANECRVDEPAADVDVGEQPPVDVVALAVEDQPHGPAVDQPVVVGARPRATALNRRPGLHRLRRVDADIADVLGPAVEPDQGGVAVDRADD